MRTALVVAVLVAVLGTCTAAVVVPLVAPGSEDAAVAAVPADAALYATAYLQPSVSQRLAVGETLGRFGVSGEQVDGVLQQAVEPLAQVGLEYERDIKPWLGDQAAVFILPAADGAQPDGAALIATSDVAATRAAVDRVFTTAGVQPEMRTHEGVEFQVHPTEPVAIGYIGGFLAAGTVGGFTAAVDASAGESLQERPEYAETAATMPEDNLLAGWIDPAGLADFAAAAARTGAPPGVEMPMDQLPTGEPAAFSVRMEDDALVFEVAQLVGDEEVPVAFADPAFLGSLPSGVIGAIGIPALGKVLTGVLDTAGDVPGGEGTQAIEEGFQTQTGLSLRNDVLAWMGDTGLFVRGSSAETIDGGLVVTSADPAATQRFVETLSMQVDSLGLPFTPAEQGGLTGFSVSDAAPAPITVLGGDRLIVGYGAAADAVVAPSGQLRDSPVFGPATGALGDGWMPTLFVDVAAARALAESLAGGAETFGPGYAAEVAPRLAEVRALIGGTRREGNTTQQRIAVLFADN